MRKLGIMVLTLLVSVTGLGLGDAYAQPDSGDLDGFWQTDGYGMALVIDGGQITIYETTTISCLTLYEGPSLFLGLELTAEGDRLEARDKGTFYVSAHRVAALPDVCTDGSVESLSEPEFTFEVVWNTFNEHYAFFDLYDVDWQASYDAFRPQVSADTTGEELFAVITEMIAPLKDGHISLFSPEEGEFSPGDSPSWVPDRETLLEIGFKQFQVLADYYLPAEVGTDQSTGVLDGESLLVGDVNVFYGAINDSVGYINILGMEGYSEDDSELDDAEIAGAIIDQALASFGKKDALVVDVRFNGGGYDSVALAIAGRFANESHLAYEKMARMGDSFAPARPFYVEPLNSIQFEGPVYVLTSQLTASAAEIFVLAMRELPNVTVVGEPTSGGFSDILARQLPNGWYVGLSNEVYTAADGQVYESLGVPPDIEIAYDPAQLDLGVDNILASVLELAMQP
ncbi:MAG: S41 family peptidase [Anaerolineales bacterium]|nr:S41 family peptidase [Anaerolineales bacterium]